MARLNLASRAERLAYRIAGLTVAVSGLFASNADPLQTAFVWRYWRPANPGEWAELIVGLVTWPIVLILGALWYTARNGAIIRRRTGRGVAAQFGDQMRLYFSAGVLAPWYYMFALHEDGGSRARSFIQRFETKPAVFPLLKRRKGSPLNQKDRFAAYCAERGIRCVKTVAQLDGARPSAPLPEADLFVKPSGGRGGKGAERWDLVTPDRFAGPEGEQLTGEELLMRLVERSRDTRLIVQPRLEAHPALADLTTGALPTIRIVTCLDEHEAPEVIGAVFRMSIGDNRTVDNFHAGGIAANVDLHTAKLSRATNMGSDARLGWVSKHPNTGAQIEGRALPLWEETKHLAIAAHREFSDRVVIGWDIAILEDGPIVIEGNGNSDMDILQRFMRIGLKEHRFGELLAYHLRARLPALRGGFALEPAAP
jgi:hypothetical protein